jgi:cell division protein FtsB
MKIIFFILLILLGLTQYQLWLGERGYSQWTANQEKYLEQQQLNQQLIQRNQRLMRDIENLKQGMDIIEEHARLEFGFIKPNEVFYQIVE